MSSNLTRSTKFQRNLRIAAVILAASLAPSAFVAWSLRDHPHLGHAHDDGLYAVTAKSLAEGRGYRALSLPGEPYQTKYPPLMPALIAALMPLAPHFPKDLTAITLGVWLFLPFLTLTFHAFLLRAGTPKGGAIALAAILPLCPLVAYFSVTLLSDVMCTAWVVCSLWLTQRAADPEAGWGRAAAAGATGAAAILTRTAAIPLLLAAPIWLAIRGRRRAATVYAVAMIPPVAWWIAWSRLHQPNSTDPVALYYLNYTGWYLDGLRPSDLWLFVSQNIEHSFTALSALLGMTMPQPSLDLVVGVLLGAAAISGAFRWARAKGTTPYHYFVLGYLPLVEVWHYRPDSRFLIPIFPFYVAALGWEIGPLAVMLFRKLRTPRERAPAVVLGAILLALGGSIAWTSASGFAFQIPAETKSRRELRASVERACEWIDHNTPPNAQVLSFYDPLVYLFTGRQGIQQPRSPKPFFRGDHDAQIAPFLDWPNFCRRYGLDYLVLTTLEMEGAMSAEDYARVRKQVLQGGAFEQTFHAPGIEIYRLVK